jgi:autotransporter adhesin
VTGTQGARRVTGIAAGAIGNGSLDAINGAQVFGVSQGFANILGGGASVGPGGILVGPTFSVQGGNYGTVYDAFGAVNTSLTSINTSIANMSTTIGNVAGDALLWSPAANAWSASHGTATTNRMTNVAAGTLSATSTDAVNGSQLYATNQQVTNNTTAIAGLNNRVTTVEGDVATLTTNVTNLDNRVTNVEGTVNNLSGTVAAQGQQIATIDQGAVKYTRDASGNLVNEVTLTGNGSGAAVVVKNVATGVEINDAVNVGQLRDAVDGLSAGNALAVRYVANASGGPTNTVVLTGDSSGAPVTITNVAAGVNDTDAVNFSQIRNQVSYDTNASGQRASRITLSGTNGAPVTIANVADGVAATDAVNVRQLNGVRSDAYTYTDSQVGALKNYTDARFDQLSGDIRDTRKEARGGIAATMAATQLRYADRPGVVSVAGGFGGFKDQTAFAAGLGWTSQDYRWRVNGAVGLSLNSGDATWAVGASYAFD